MRILYVEDNTTNVILVQRVAHMGKHVVVNYNNGQETLDNFEQDAPDLILMDIQLQGALNGLEVVQQLRSRGTTVPIIALTAYAMKGDRQRCLDAGCDDYIPKPISVSELVSVFKRFNDAVIAKAAINPAAVVASPAVAETPVPTPPIPAPVKVDEVKPSTTTAAPEAATPTPTPAVEAPVTAKEETKLAAESPLIAAAGAVAESESATPIIKEENKPIITPTESTPVAPKVPPTATDTTASATQESPVSDSLPVSVTAES